MKTLINTDKKKLSVPYQCLQISALSVEKSSVEKENRLHQGRRNERTNK